MYKLTLYFAASATTISLVFQEIVGKVEADSVNISSLSQSSVINEIFNSTLQEIIHEVNIPLDTLTDPILLGIARNTTSAGRPSSEYYVRSVVEVVTHLIRSTKLLYDGPG